MNRLHCITQKVPTQFGSLYVHVEHDDGGMPHAVAFSSPGKFDSTAVGAALEALAAAVIEIMAAIGGAA